MHFVPFAFKRAHYTSLLLTRDLAGKFGLTPARFDLLACVRKLRHGDDRGDTRRHHFQASVARALGVSQVTVSRMVDALAASGLVRRIVDPHDTRKRWIQITNEGRRRYFLLLQRLRGKKPLKRLFQGLAAKHVRYLEGSYEYALLWLSDHVSSFRKILNALGDGSTFRHPDWDFVDT